MLKELLRITTTPTTSEEEDDRGTTVRRLVIGRSEKVHLQLNIADAFENFDLARLRDILLSLRRLLVGRVSCSVRTDGHQY